MALLTITYTDTPSTSVGIKKVHVSELVTAVTNIATQTKTTDKISLSGVAYTNDIVNANNIKLLQTAVNNLQGAFSSNCCQANCCQTCQTQKQCSQSCQSQTCQTTKCQTCQKCQSCQTSSCQSKPQCSSSQCKECTGTACQQTSCQSCQRTPTGNSCGGDCDSDYSN